MPSDWAPTCYRRPVVSAQTEDKPPGLLARCLRPALSHPLSLVPPHPAHQTHAHATPLGRCATSWTPRRCATSLRRLPWRATPCPRCTGEGGLTRALLPCLKIPLASWGRRHSGLSGTSPARAMLAVYSARVDRCTPLQQAWRSDVADPFPTCPPAARCSTRCLRPSTLASCACAPARTGGQGGQSSHLGVLYFETEESMTQCPLVSSLCLPWTSDRHALRLAPATAPAMQEEPRAPPAPLLPVRGLRRCSHPKTSAVR